MKTVPVQCVKCGKVDHVEDSIIVLALHKCSICKATGGTISFRTTSPAPC